MTRNNIQPEMICRTEELTTKEEAGWQLFLHGRQFLMKVYRIKFLLLHLISKLKAKFHRVSCCWFKKNTKTVPVSYCSGPGLQQLEEEHCLGGAELVFV